MKHLLLVITALFTGALHGLATGEYNLQWQKGNTFYEQKQYDSAAIYYEQIAALKPQNAEIYYNLGNTYYRLNKIPLAILNYERALHINPAYKQAQDNLALAQNRITNHIQSIRNFFVVDWWESITRPGKATTWAVTALATFILIILTVLYRRLTKTDSKLVPVQLTGLLVFICICFLVLAYTAANKSAQNTGAVVMVTDAPLMNNEQKGKPLMLVPEGTTVKIKSEKGTWAEVTLPDGRSGWLQESLLEKI